MNRTGETVIGIYKTRREVYYAETESIARYAHRFFIPALDVGTMQRDDHLSIVREPGGDAVGEFNVVDMAPDSDGWYEVTLSRKPGI